ncbi:MAG: regulator [Rhodocyclaceae bacterium]|nr:regulator [Rhodocyclaceae bacterium]
MPDTFFDHLLHFCNGPETVRRALRLSKQDRIHDSIRPGGELVLTRASALGRDGPVLGEFLGFLARDMAQHPERLQAINAGLLDRLRALTGVVEVDLDAPLSADDE